MGPLLVLLFSSGECRGADSECFAGHAFKVQRVQIMRRLFFLFAAQGHQAERAEVFGHMEELTHDVFTGNTVLFPGMDLYPVGAEPQMFRFDLKGKGCDGGVFHPDVTDGFICHDDDDEGGTLKSESAGLGPAGGQCLYFLPVSDRKEAGGLSVSGRRGRQRGTEQLMEFGIGDSFVRESSYAATAGKEIKHGKPPDGGPVRSEPGPMEFVLADVTVPVITVCIFCFYQR